MTRTRTTNPRDPKPPHPPPTPTTPTLGRSRAYTSPPEHAYPPVADPAPRVYRRALATIAGYAHDPTDAAQLCDMLGITAAKLDPQATP